MASEPVSKLLVLVVDDSVTMVNALAGYLELAGFRAETAANGVEGYNKARTLQPALILLDVTMPGLDGFEVAGMLKADPATAEIPIIFVTGHAEKAAILRGLRTGADDYLTKPFDLQVLAEHMAAVLRRSPSSQDTHKEETS